MFTTTALQRSGCKQKLTTADEQLIVRKIRLNTKAHKREIAKDLEFSGSNAPTSTIKRILHKNDLNRYCERKKPWEQG